MINRQYTVTNPLMNLSEGQLSAFVPPLFLKNCWTSPKANLWWTKNGQNSTSSFVIQRISYLAWWKCTEQFKYIHVGEWFPCIRWITYSICHTSHVVTYFYSIHNYQLWRMELWNSNKFPFRDIDNFFNWILFYFALNNELYLFWTRFIIYNFNQLKIISFTSFRTNVFKPFSVDF